MLGVVTIVVVEAIGSTLVKPGEDVIEPALLVAGVVLYGVTANVAYTLGWITELFWSAGDTSKTEALRDRIFFLGLLVASMLTLFPTILVSLIWVAAQFTRR